jgi:hypothetical protein
MLLCSSPRDHGSMQGACLLNWPSAATRSSPSPLGARWILLNPSLATDTDACLVLFFISAFGSVVLTPI